MVTIATGQVAGTTKEGKVTEGGAGQGDGRGYRVGGVPQAAGPPSNRTLSFL